MSNNIIISNIDPQEITINGSGQPTGITNVYVNGVDVTIGTKAYVLVPTNNNELINGAGYITGAEETDPTVPAYVKAISLADINSWNDKQDALVSGSTIKTLNGESLLGSGNINIVSNYVAGTGIDITDNTISNTITSYNDLSDRPTIPTRTSDLVNDSGFITNQTDSLVNYLTTEVLEDILPHTSDSGTGELYLEDSAHYKIKMELNPSEIGQHTTTGAQLFDKDDDNNTAGYLKNDGTVQANSSYTASDYIDVSQFSDITISGNSGSSELNCWYDSNKDYLSSFGMGSLTTTTQSVPTGASYIRVTVKNTSLDTYMIESGSTASAYESYTGGMASPNPLYPQDLHIITGENSITIGNRNLFPNNGTTTTTNGITFTVNSDGTVHVSNTATANAYLTYPSFRLKAGTYTLSAGVFINTLTRIQLVEDIPTRPLLASTQSASSDTFTIAEDKNVFLQFRINNGEVMDTTFYPQLEIGSTATSYVAHQETVYPIDLGTGYYLKLDGISDRIYKNIPSDPDYMSNVETGKWCIRNNVVEVYLIDIGEFTQVVDQGDKYSFYNNDTVNVPRRDICINPYGKSIYFNNDADGNNNIIEITGVNQIRIDMDKKVGISTIEELTQWINDNQVIAYFSLLPEYYDSKGYLNDSLNTQLNNLTENNTAYEGGTNISQENDDLPFDINADTLKKIS